MECMSFSRLFMAVSLILIYVIQKLVGLAHQASPVNLKPSLHDGDMDVRHLAFEDQLQFIDSDEYKTDELLKDIQLDSVSVSYLSVSVLLFELNERQGCLGAANYSVIRTFSAVNVGQMVLQIRGFKIGSSTTASNILRGRLYNVAKQHQQQQQTAATTATKTQQQHQQQHNNNNNNNNNNHHHYHHKHNNLHNNNNNHQLNSRQQSVCQGYGFTIYDCEPFDLEPNREHKIRIAFNPDFTLTKTIVSLTILTNLDEEFKFALVASIPRNLLATCNQSIPRPDWEPTMHLLLAVGMVIMILVSILSAYMEAMLYLRSQQVTSAQSANNHNGIQSSNHHNGKDHERSNNCSNHSTDTCNKDRGNGSGHGAAAISASISSQQHQQSSSSIPFNSLANGNNNSGKNTSSNNFNLNNHSSNNNNNKSNKSNNNNNNSTQKRRKNSSTTNNNGEKVPTTTNSNNNNKSIGSITSDKKASSSPYAPIFQNLTNVISSPPPPLPTFDSDPNSSSLEFKKLRGKKSAKKASSLNGSIASSSDDIGNTSSLNQNVSGSSQISRTTKINNSNNGKTKLNSSGINSIINNEREGQLDRSLGIVGENRKVVLKDVFTSSLPNGNSCLDNVKLYNNNIINGAKKNDKSQQEQATVMPIQPPSSLSSTPSSSSTASTSSSSSSTSSSPPLSSSSYGEYSLLGPGATFELPCLRVRSSQV